MVKSYVTSYVHADHPFWVVAPQDLFVRPRIFDGRCKKCSLPSHVARYELFKASGCEHGHDWEDWFRAESELLHPVSISMQESADQISLHANVTGFEENELGVNIEPGRLSILGKKKMGTTVAESGKTGPINWTPDWIMQVVDLPSEIVPETVVVVVQAGQLRFDLQKAERKREAADVA
jgi:HSP20 family molecular chaperone IbpA